MVALSFLHGRNEAITLNKATTTPLSNLLTTP